VKKSTRMFLAGLAVAGLIATSSVAVATAASPAVGGGPAGGGVCATQAQAVKAGATVENLRAFGDCEIARRLTTLDKLTDRIAKAKALTSSDASTLSGLVSSTRSGLTSLKSTIDSETSIDALKADVRKIATDFRVYVLLSPQVNLVRGADAVQASKTVFDKIAARLSARITAAKAAGKDTAAAETALAAMNKSVTDAIALASPLPARLLPLTPAQWNDGSAGPVIKDAREKLVQARALIQSARKSAQACRDALK
jgi:hypothetical protein